MLPPASMWYFFVLNVYLSKIDEKRGCPDTPPFRLNLELIFPDLDKKMGCRRFGTDLELPNIFKSGHLDV